MNNNLPRWFLHISDIHAIAKSESRLRSDGFKEYLDELKLTAEAFLDGERLSGILFSGDFVDRFAKGKESEFAHAEAIILYLRDIFGCSSTPIVCCYGNHDIIREDPKNAAGRADDQDVAALIERLHASCVPLKSSRYGKLFKVAEGLFTLSLNSLMGEDGVHGVPQTPPQTEIDIITKWIRDTLGKTDGLIVISHYPLSDFHILDDINERVWFGGRPLARSIVNTRIKQAKGATIWLSGDIHTALGLQSFMGLPCVLGPALASPDRKSSIQNFGAQFFRISPGSTEIVVKPCRFVEVNHQNLPGGHGDWEVKPDKKIAVGIPSGVEPSDGENPASKKLEPELFNSDQDQRIYESVANGKLYKMGRFETIDDPISISWVTTGPLLSPASGMQTAAGNDRYSGLLPDVLKEMTTWIESKRKELGLSSDCEKTVLIGVDCWGAIMASEISLRTGWTNFCVAGRGKANAYTDHERSADVTSEVRIRTYKADLVVLVTDVIASGKTLQWLRSDILKRQIEDPEVKKLAPDIKATWIAACVLCDPDCDRGDATEGLAAIGAACTKVKMPLIPRRFMPDTDLLAPDLSFSPSGSLRDE